MIGGAFSKEDALKLWPLVEPLIKRATDLDHGRSTPDTIKELISQDKALLWADKNLKMVLVSSVEEYPTGKKTLLLRVCGGEDLSICKQAFPMLKDYARDMGCDSVEVRGRKGWLKVLPEFKEDYTVLRVAL